VMAAAYALGQHVPRDQAEAARLFRAAAEQGDAPGQAALGNLYRTGQGVERDNAEALKWLQKSAVQGYADGQYALALMYFTDSPLMKADLVQTYKWSYLAEKQGTHGAIMFRDTAMNLMTPLQRIEAERLVREFVTVKNQPPSTPCYKQFGR